jgi:translation initiation factor eIF-2B subunit beta
VLHLLREEARAAHLETTSQVSSVHFAAHVFDGPSTPTQPTHLKASSSLPPSSTSSSSNTTPSRPQLSAFRPGSTFSISDLVAAGASASGGTSTMHTPLGSGSSTPAWGNQSIEGLGYGVERLQIHQEENEDSSDSDEDDEDTESDRDERVESKSKKQGVYQLKPLLIQAIQELIDELDTVDTSIAKDARDHIHSGEVIFTLGYSKTVEVFLKAASKDRKFTVIVAECAPDYSGHVLARALSSAGISTLLVPDSSTFTLMPRISKILLGAHSILANGGLLTYAGSRMVAEAARAHSTPTVVLAGVYKVCPDWAWVGIGTSLVNKSGMPSISSPSSQRLTYSNQGSPLDVVAFDEEGADQVEIVNPVWDYIDPDLIDLLLTNVGEHPVSLVYRLLSENYDAQDLVL